METKPQITLIGAGLVGSLLSVYLARRGFQVEVYERRSDPRALRALGKVGEGRSINLAISTRGLYGLEQVGLKESVLPFAIPMNGRQMHAPSGELTYQAYGSSGDCINSISRGWLNGFLLDEAEKNPNIRFHFDQKIERVNLEQRSFTLVETKTQKERKLFYDKLIGTDGSASAVRKSLLKAIPQSQISEEELSHGYKEFIMPEKAPNTYKMEKNALHIWPRGDFMMIALPNLDGSYTCTLFMRQQGTETSFDKLQTPEAVKSFLQTHFADFLQLVPDAVEQYFEHPTGKMVTIKCSPWSYKDQVLLMGDASHAIVPFFGQGMNAGFEDVVQFAKLLDQNLSWQDLFDQFFQARKANSDAIADMAVENLTEMSEKTADPRFLYQKKIEKILQENHPQDYRSRYSLVSFSRVPYALAYKAGQVQEHILNQITEDHYPELKFDESKALEMIRERLSPVMKEIEPYLKG